MIIYLKNLNLLKPLVLASALTFLLMAGCKKLDRAEPGPVISGISILNGLAGSSVTISGSHFESDTSKVRVQFNGVSAKIISASSTSIVVVVPENALTGKVSLTSNGKTTAYPSDFVIILPVPVIDDVLITSLSNSCLIRITGKDFNPDMTKNIVKIGDQGVTVVGVNATQLFARTGSVKAAAQVTLTAYGKTLVYPISLDFPSYTTTAYTTPSAVSYLSADAAENVYGTSGNKVIKISSAGVISTMATIGSDKNLLLGSAADAAGNIYAAGNSDRKIYKITPAGVVSTFAGAGISGYADGQGDLAQFTAPVGLTIDGNGNLFVCDSNRVRKITPARVVSTFAGSGNSGSSDGQGTSATFSSLLAVTADQDNNLFLINTSGLLRKISAGGSVTTLDLWGPRVGDGGYNRPVWPHGIKSGTQIATDRSGNLIVGNTQGIMYGTSISNAYISFPVYIIDRSGFVEEFSSTAYVGYLGFVFDKNGNLYISERSYAYTGSFIAKYSIH